MPGDDLHPAYIALIRHELRLPAGSDALAELASRLAPPERRQRPPARAPGIVRLKAALRRLLAHQIPTADLDAFADDLRFLRMFDDDPSWTREVVDRLLPDVLREGVPKKRARGARGTAAKVVPLRRRGGA